MTRRHPESAGVRLAGAMLLCAAVATVTIIPGYLYIHALLGL